LFPSHDQEEAFRIAEDFQHFNTHDKQLRHVQDALFFLASYAKSLEKKLDNNENNTYTSQEV